MYRKDKILITGNENMLNTFKKESNQPFKGITNRARTRIEDALNQIISKLDKPESYSLKQLFELLPYYTDIYAVLIVDMTAFIKDAGIKKVRSLDYRDIRALYYVITPLTKIKKGFTQVNYDITDIKKLSSGRDTLIKVDGYELPYYNIIKYGLDLSIKAEFIGELFEDSIENQMNSSYKNRLHFNTDMVEFVDGKPTMLPTTDSPETREELYQTLGMIVQEAPLSNEQLANLHQLKTDKKLVRIDGQMHVIDMVTDKVSVVSLYTGISRKKIVGFVVNNKLTTKNGFSQILFRDLLIELNISDIHLLKEGYYESAIEEYSELIYKAIGISDKEIDTKDNYKGEK